MSLVLDAIIVSIDGAIVVILVAGSGALMARTGVRTTQVLDQATTEKVSSLTVNLLLPCLLFTDLIKNLNINELGDFGLIFALATLHILVGCSIGWVFSKITRAYRDLRRLMMCSIGFQDTTAIPLVYAMVLGKDKIIDPDDNFSDKAVEYVLIYSVFIIIYKWKKCLLIFYITTNSSLLMNCSTSSKPEGSKRLPYQIGTK